MEIKDAIEHLFNSEEFKGKAKEKNKEGGRLRMFASRYQRGQVSKGTAIDLLDEFGYELNLKAPESKHSQND